MTLVVRRLASQALHVVRRAIPWCAPLVAWMVLAAIAHPGSRNAFDWAQALGGAWAVVALACAAAWGCRVAPQADLFDPAPAHPRWAWRTHLLIGLWAAAVAAPTAVTAGRPMAVMAALGLGMLAGGRRGLASASGSLLALQALVEPFDGPHGVLATLYVLPADAIGLLEAGGRKASPLDLSHAIEMTDWFSARLLFDEAARLGPPAQLMGRIGLAPAGLVVSALNLVWCLASWRLGTIARAMDRLDWRPRFLLTLALMCTFASLAAMLWSFGWTSRPLGPGLLPFVSHKGWWVVMAALAGGWIWLERSRRARGIAHPALKLGARAMALPAVAFAVFTSINVSGAWWVKTAVGLRAATAASAADSRHPVLERRKAILDRNGLVLAHDTDAIDLWVTPKRLFGPCDSNGHCYPSMKPEVLDALQRVLASDRSALEQLLHRTGPSARFDVGSGPVALVLGADARLIHELDALDLQGLEVKASRVRRYSQGPLFSHAVGYVQRGARGVGLEGLEAALQRDLLPDPSKPGERADPWADDALSTTLDRLAQQAAHDALLAAMRQQRATSGAAVVLDARTGAVRALVSLPDFDPNLGSTFRNPPQHERLRNRTLTVPLAPGNLMAPVAAAMAIEDGRLSPRSLLSNRPLQVPDPDTKQPMRFTSTIAQAELSLEQAVVRQAEPALARLNLMWSGPQLHAWLHRLAGQPDDSFGLIPSVAQQVPDVSEWSPATRAAWPAGVHLSLMQLLRLYLPLASDGGPRTVHTVANVDTEACLHDLNTDRCNERRLWSAETASAVRRMLVLAAPTLGAGPAGQVPWLDVGGIGDAGFSLSSDAQIEGWHSTFIGMAPADKPRWLIGVTLAHRLERDPTPHLGASASGPAFARIAKTLREAEPHHARLGETAGKAAQRPDR